MSHLIEKKFHVFKNDIQFDCDKVKILAGFDTQQEAMDFVKTQSKKELTETMFKRCQWYCKKNMGFTGAMGNFAIKVPDILYYYHGGKDQIVYTIRERSPYWRTIYSTIQFEANFECSGFKLKNNTFDGIIVDYNFEDYYRSTFTVEVEICGETFTKIVPAYLVEPLPETLDCSCVLSKNVQEE